MKELNTIGYIMNDKVNGSLKICELENGETMPYDVCSARDNYYNPKHFTLLGKGKIVSVNGFTQVNSCVGYYFYKRSE